MELSDFLAQFERMYAGDGNYCEYGCGVEDVETMIARAKEIAPNMYYCTAADWVWIDINYPDPSYIEQYHERGFQPSFVRTDSIIHDEAQRAHIRKSVSSTALVSFYNNCIFRTRNTMYILVGKGSRVSIDAEALRSMVDW